MGRGKASNRSVPRGNRPTSENTRQLRAERGKLEALNPGTPGASRAQKRPARARAGDKPGALEVKRQHRKGDEYLPGVEAAAVIDVADAAFDVAKLFAAAPWRAPDGGPWPDSGWAMVRGCVITLAYEEWARAYGMKAPPVVDGFAELAGVVEQARAIFQALPLAGLAPEYFGHVHEIRRFRREWHERLRSEVVEVVPCKGCRKPFARTAYDVMRKRGWVCSRACSGRARGNIKVITIEGESLTLTAWAARHGLKLATVHRRIAVLRWSLERALRTPTFNRGQHRAAAAE